MRLIHTADWHLGHRLGRIDRADHIRRAVGRVVDVCLRERADVLLICGDLFHDVGRAEVLRESVEHLGAVLAPFFAGGGTALCITGNHDKENLVQVLQQTMRLAAPQNPGLGGELATGRFHLFPGPTFFRLPDPQSAGARVQFVMLPYPTATRYLDEPNQRFTSTEERNRAVRSAFTRRIGTILAHPKFDKRLQTVLAAHVITRGAEIRDGFGLNEGDAVVLDGADLPAGFAYVALGDVHKPQCLGGLSHVRYAGSIERLDLGEAGDEKGVVVVDVGPEGRRGEPRWVPLETTPLYRVRIEDPPAELPGLEDRYPDHEAALVNLHLTYQPGRDNLNDVLAELERVFPNWYERRWAAAGGAAEGVAGAGTAAGPDASNVGETVRGYLAGELAGHPDRDELVALAEALLAEEEAES